MVFKEIDIDGNEKVTLEEFKKALPLLKKWNVEIDNPEQEFEQIDEDKSGSIMFDEFTHFCIKQRLNNESKMDDLYYEEARKYLLEDAFKPENFKHYKNHDDREAREKMEQFLNNIKFSDIDWKTIKKNLPCKKNEEHKKKRDRMFQDFDPNGNKYLSLAECDKGFLDMGPAMTIIY